jgi:hypothetical protein
MVNRAPTLDVREAGSAWAQADTGWAGSSRCRIEAVDALDAEQHPRVVDLSRDELGPTVREVQHRW